MVIKNCLVSYGFSEKRSLIKGIEFVLSGKSVYQGQHGVSAVLIVFFLQHTKLKESPIPLSIESEKRFQ